MDGVWQFLQSYGPWLALSGGLLFLMYRNSGSGCCGSSCSADATRHDPVEALVETTMISPTGRAQTTDDLRSQLADLQAQQEQLAQQIARLSAKPVTTSATTSDPVVRTGGGWVDAVKRGH